jgi:pimeloyl-ACP methyl ester carboxylesterase
LKSPPTGPIYNLGVAQEIVRGLVRTGYPLGSGRPVTLIGWSGGGQISIGAATHLYSMLGAPLRVISLGGVLSDDPGLLSLVHLYHLYGDNDPVQRLGAILYAGRWPGAVQSPWGRANVAGRITLRSLGPVAHNGDTNYFATQTCFPNGQSYAASTVQAMLQVLREAGIEPPAPTA